MNNGHFKTDRTRFERNIYIGYVFDECLRSDKPF